MFGAQYRVCQIEKLPSGIKQVGRFKICGPKYSACHFLKIGI